MNKNTSLIMIASLIAIVVITTITSLIYKSEIENQMGIKQLKAIQKDIVEHKSLEKEQTADVVLTRQILEKKEENLRTTTGNIAILEEQEKRLKTAMKYLDLALTWTGQTDTLSPNLTNE